MQREELTALGELAGDAAGGLASTVEQMHSGIANRVWRAVGPAAIPVKGVHDQIAARGYAAARQLTRGVVRGGVRALSATQPREAESIERTLGGRAVIGALNGIWGDTLARRENRLALKMSARAGGTSRRPEARYETHIRLRPHASRSSSTGFVRPTTPGCSVAPATCHTASGFRPS
jgi:hypothetical protein